MEINYWYLAILVISLVYIIPVLIIRSGINRRKGSRRTGERRVCLQAVEIDRRREFSDRRQRNRRG